MEFITTLLGRFHPLIVHLPIGILFLSFLFECLSFREQYKVLRKAVQPALFLGALFAIAAATSGYFLRQEGGYTQAIADRHQNFGIITAVLSLVVFVVRPKVKYWVDDPVRKKQVRLALSVPLILCLSITGHWGGALTHGEDYLFAAVSLERSGAKDPGEKIRAISNIEQAVLYDDIVQPILEARCYDCHSASRQKGDLRLDGVEFISRGGKNGPILRSGPADSSSLYRRLVLPLEHEEHMPPNEKPQLSSSEIALIQYWVEGNASFDKSVSAFETKEKIASIVKSLQQPPQQSWIPTEETSAASEGTLRKLRDIGVMPMPLAEGSNYIMVTFTGKNEVTDEQIKGLQNIERQLVWLNLSHSGITDQQMEAVGKLRNLRLLYLNNTGITDTGLAHLASVTELRTLNLVGTRISDASEATLTQLKNLTNLYLYGTDVTGEVLAKLAEANKTLKIDTGNYMLEKLPTDTIVFRRVSK